MASQQFTESQPRSRTQQQGRVQLVSHQQPPSQPLHESREKQPKKVVPEVAPKLKKTRGITRGLGAHDIVNATKACIPIQMNHEQKLPMSIKANALFSSEIGSQTRKLAPLTVKTWKEVSEADKKTIRTAIAIKFDFDDKDPDMMKHIEGRMSKSYAQWKCKLHKHFKLHADDLEYARAHPPSEKLWGNRKMAEWHYLCNELYTKEDYQTRCKTNAENRSKLKYNHCGGSRPFQKHMEATLETGKDLTVVENWGIMHQHRSGSGTWVNNEAAKIGKKMLDELEKEKKKLAEIQSISTEEISVPLPRQLEILKNGVGSAKGKTIKGLGGPKRLDSCTAANSSYPDYLYTHDELLSTIGQLAMEIKALEDKFTSFAKQNMSPPFDDGIGEKMKKMDSSYEDGEDEYFEEGEEQLEKEPLDEE